MLWFKRLFASRHKPVGMPNFATAPWVDIDLSGTKLRFKTPPMAAMNVEEYWPETLDIYNQDNFKLWPNSNGAIRAIFESHWSYYGNLFDDEVWELAGLDVRINVTRLSIKHRSYDSLLYSKQSLCWCFDCQFNDFNDFNEGIKKKYPQRLASAMKEFGTTEFEPPISLYTHPQNPSDIQSITAPTGIPFFVYKTRLDDLPWRQVWHTAITEDHSIEIIFSIGTDLKLSNIPETEAEIEKTIAEFMANFHIQYTPSTLEKMEAIKRESEHNSIS